MTQRSGLSTRKFIPAGKRVLISGVGIAGPTLAYWLHRYGFIPTLVERAPAPRTGGYMIDFWGVGYEVARRMDLLPAIERDGYHVKEVRIVNTVGERVAGFDASVFDAATGGQFVSLLRGDLARRVYEAIENDVETVFGDSITALKQESSGVTVTFEHSAPRQFDIVVGADGLHSNVRSLMFGKATDPVKPLGYYVAAFSSYDYSHRDEGVYVSYSIPGRQLARYALRGGRSAFLLIFAHNGFLPIIHDSRAVQRQFLRSIFGGAGWEADEILDAMDAADDFYFDTVAQTRLLEWSNGCVALIGDAAYCPSLLAGQGAALAMAGAYEFAHLLATSEDHHEAFARFQQRFKPFVDGKQRSAEKLGWWFAPESSLGVRLRNLGTNALRLPLIGNLIARRSFSDDFKIHDEILASKELHQVSN